MHNQKRGCIATWKCVLPIYFVPLVRVVALNPPPSVMLCRCKQLKCYGWKSIFLQSSQYSTSSVAVQLSHFHPKLQLIFLNTKLFGVFLTRFMFSVALASTLPLLPLPLPRPPLPLFFHYPHPLYKQLQRYNTAIYATNTPHWKT